MGKNFSFVLFVCLSTVLLAPFVQFDMGLGAQENPWVKQSKEIVSAIEMVRIPGSTFWMGSQSEEASKNEQPVHQETLKSFYMSKTEVTQGQWIAIMGENPSNFKKGENYPVEFVSWDDVQNFIQKLNKLTGKHYRLPTEAEWEFAARGGKDGPGNDRYGNIDDIAWYLNNSGNSPHPVGQKQPNKFGLYDMLGNVNEWVQDWLVDYSSNSQTSPTGPKASSYRVYRGGSWSNPAQDCRAPYRKWYSPVYRLNFLGFRLAMDVE